MRKDTAHTASDNCQWFFSSQAAQSVQGQRSTNLCLRILINRKVDRMTMDAGELDLVLELLEAMN